MKLICPHCGLKGTAEDALLDKKIKCPKCLQIFLLKGEIAVSPLQTTDQSPETEESVADQPEPTSEEQPVGNAEEENAAAQNHPLPSADVGQCSNCGFYLSHAYLTEVDSKQYCMICAPAE